MRLKSRSEKHDCISFSLFSLISLLHSLMKEQEKDNVPSPPSSPPDYDEATEEHEQKHTTLIAHHDRPTQVHFSIFFSFFFSYTVARNMTQPYDENWPILHWSLLWMLLSLLSWLLSWSMCIRKQMVNLLDILLLACKFNHLYLSSWHWSKCALLVVLDSMYTYTFTISWLISII